MDLEKAGDVRKVLTEIINRINEDRRRIRLIEQNIDRVESGINSLERSVLAQLGDVKISVERVNNKLSDLSNKTIAMEAEISRISKTTKKAATKTEIQQLEKFIDLVNPITSKFVTRDELERALEERIRRKTQV